MKSIFKITIGLMACAFALVACDDDDDSSNSTPITINAVYLQDADASVPNRQVDFVRLGQLVRIEGTGIKGINRIYINGYSCYFNPVLLTDNNVWVTVDSDVPISDADEDVRNTIVLSKPSGVSCTFSIEVRSASPTITSINNTLPKEGETVKCTGTGLLEVSSVILPNGTEITENIESDEDGEWFTFIMPTITDSIAGSLFITCANGSAYSPQYFNYYAGIILDFDGTGVQSAWSWSETGSMLDYSEADGGTDTYGDDIVDDPAGTGRGYCANMTPDRLLPMGTKERLTEVWTAGGQGSSGYSDPTEDWTRFVDGEFITESTSLDDLAIQFDLYIDGEMTTGYLLYMLTNNYSSNTNRPYSGIYKPVIDNDGEPVTTDGWETITLPLNEFDDFTADDGTFTFADVIDARYSASYANTGMILSNNDITIDDETYTMTLNIDGFKIYVDNFRIVNCYTPEYDEFGDEDTEE